jgi:hypothetical protein
VTFKPYKKLTSYSDYIKIIIGGSHVELVPLFINVDGPDVYIKEAELQPEQYAICGS